jgi:hypothetical protein
VELAKRMDAAKLRKAFAVFVLAMAAFMIYREAPAPLLQAVFVERWPFWAGGLAIGLFVIGFLLLARQPLGVSTGFADACAAPFDGKALRSWRLPFLLGIVGGGFLAALAAGAWAPSFEMGLFDRLVTSSLALKAAIFAAGGVLVGYGARLAGGCTSGHCIVGVAQLAPSSLLATGAFMVSGFAVTNLVLRLFGS